jgi:hypothetical protein
MASSLKTIMQVKRKITERLNPLRSIMPKGWRLHSYFHHVLYIDGNNFLNDDAEH